MSNVTPRIAANSDPLLLKALADSIHRHGAALMSQITHMRHRTYWNVEHWFPVIAPSRVGDAVASRNIHAAIHDSLRLCKDL